MTAPLCTVTPLEALRRLYDVARKVDAKESGEFETLLQGELAVAEAAMRAAAAPVACPDPDACNRSGCCNPGGRCEEAAPVVPVAAQPVVPEGWQMVPKALTDEMIVAFAEQWYSHQQVFDDPEMADAYKSMLAVAPQPAASVTDVAKDAALAIVPDWPFCNPACDYEDPYGGQHDERSAFCSCEQAKASICRQRAAIAAQQGEKT